MSRKYFDKLLVGSGQTSKVVESKFGEKMLAKMGWSKGDGLGKNLDGMTDCIQVKRRDENLGMGAELETVVAKFKWNDQFWDDAYNEAAAKFSATVPKTPGKALVNNDDTIDDMLDISSNDNDSGSDDASFSSFDGEIEIEKCT